MPQSLLPKSWREAMPARLRSDDGKHVLIRPLAYVSESDLEAYAQLRGFPIIPCDLCGSQENLQRKVVGRMLKEWERTEPGRVESILRDQYTRAQAEGVRHAVRLGSHHAGDAEGCLADRERLAYGQAHSDQQRFLNDCAPAGLRRAAGLLKLQQFPERAIGFEAQGSIQGIG